MSGEMDPEEPLERGGTGAIIVDPEGSYLCQHRDDRPTVELRDHWGLFGGAVESGETPDETMRRELYEELGLRVTTCQPFIRLWADLSPIAPRRVQKHFFVVPVGLPDLADIRLREGQNLAWLSYCAFTDGRPVNPADLMAIYLHRHHRVMRQVLARPSGDPSGCGSA